MRVTDYTMVANQSEDRDMVKAIVILLLIPGSPIVVTFTLICDTTVAFYNLFESWNGLQKSPMDG